MIALRLLRAFVLAGAGAVVALAQLNLPSRSFWEDLVLLQWGSVGVVAVFVCVDAGRSVSYAVQATRIRDYDNDLRAVLGAAVAEVVRSTGAPWDEVAARYYRQRGGLRPWRRLDRVAAVKAGADVEDGQRSIRPSVGLAGVAFSTQMVVAEEWREFVRRATREGPEVWAQRTARDRYGLNWGQLRRSPQPQGMVASPTFGPNGRPNGCVALSGPLKLPDLVSDEVWETLDDLAAALELLGPPPAGWWSAHER